MLHASRVTQRPPMAGTSEAEGSLSSYASGNGDGREVNPLFDMDSLSPGNVMRQLVTLQKQLWEEGSARRGLESRVKELTLSQEVLSRHLVDCQSSLDSALQRLRLMEQLRDGLLKENDALQSAVREEVNLRTQLEAQLAQARAAGGAEICPIANEEAGPGREAEEGADPESDIPAASSPWSPSVAGVNNVDGLSLEDIESMILDEESDGEAGTSRHDCTATVHLPRGGADSSLNNNFNLTPIKTERQLQSQDSIASVSTPGGTRRRYRHPLTPQVRMLEASIAAVEVTSSAALLKENETLTRRLVSNSLQLAQLKEQELVNSRELRALKDINSRLIEKMALMLDQLEDYRQEMGDALPMKAVKAPTLFKPKAENGALEVMTDAF